MSAIDSVEFTWSSAPVPRAANEMTRANAIIPLDQIEIKIGKSTL